MISGSGMAFLGLAWFSLACQDVNAKLVVSPGFIFSARTNSSPLKQFNAIQNSRQGIKSEKNVFYFNILANYIVVTRTHLTRYL